MGQALPVSPCPAQRHTEVLGPTPLSSCLEPIMSPEEVPEPMDTANPYLMQAPSQAPSDKPAKEIGLGLDGSHHTPLLWLTGPRQPATRGEWLRSPLCHL